MLRKSIRNCWIAWICIALAACAATRKSAEESTQVSIVHLTRPAATLNQQLIETPTLTNPQQRGNVITGTADLESTPLAIIESVDGYAPDSPSLLSEEEQQPIEATPAQMEVQQGDTVYSLARKYDKKVDDIALINDLDSAYTIFPGQVLVLPPAGFVANNTAVTDKPKKAESKEALDSEAKPAAVTDLAAGKTGGISWSWPLAGKPKVLREFGKDGGNTKGIDIEGAIGDPVYAVSDGTVVYSGNKLKGYGNLVIISHRNDFMSAYAHNSKLTVRPDDEVKRGQKIAEVGSVESNSAKLFFQVRHKGEPVDPISYLPKR